ncbi:MAG TPA: MBL fold metallo-hydrolase [Chloroflexota bacterium]|nr:MBL fold metallo-hydrolase [Chloroflexota bacterium]
MMKAMDEYVHSRSVGDVTATAINDAMMPGKVELTVPEEVWRQVIDADAEGSVPGDVNVLVVQTGDATILIDTGLGEPGSRRDEYWEEEWPGSVRTPGVVRGLAELGISPEDITHILITHSHFDHVFGLAVERDGTLVPRYPNARVFLGRADWENAAPEHLEPEPEARIRAVADAGLLDLVEGEREIVPGVAMIPAPGESPGHSIIRVSSRGDSLYAVGDLFHYPAEVEHLDWNVPWADPEQMRASRRSLLDAAAGTDALVVFTHETFPPWGRILGNQESGYRWHRVP